MNFRQTTLIAAMALASLPVLAQTAAAPAAPASDWTVAGNAGLFSDYTFRGISQTARRPALQGGIDVGHSSGFYVGNWNSNIDANMYTGANLEMDFYGGYKLSAGDFGFDFGAIYYYYPGSGAAGTTKIDNTEFYVGASWGPLTAKYSYAVTDFFSASDSKGSSYLDFGFSHDLGKGFGVNAHVGFQTLKGGAVVAQINGSMPDSITDYKVGATYTIDGFVIGGAAVGTNRDYTAGTASLTNKNISKNTFVVSVSKSF
jgi:uncharacterized protein (TIGR02001 family)